MTKASGIDLGEQAHCGSMSDRLTQAYETLEHSLTLHRFNFFSFLKLTSTTCSCVALWENNRAEVSAVHPGRVCLRHRKLRLTERRISTSLLQIIANDQGNRTTPSYGKFPTSRQECRAWYESKLRGCLFSDVLRWLSPTASVSWERQPRIKSQ